MLDCFGSGRVYYFTPDAHAAYQKKILEVDEFPETVLLTFEKDYIRDWSAETVAELFADYGDFYAQKSTEDSIFLEFFYIDPKVVPGKNLQTFISLVKSRNELRIVSGCVHKDAPRFVAHDRFDYM